MSGKPDNLDAALQAMLSGDLESLSPEQVTRLEGLLNSDPALAARVSRQVASAPGPLGGALAAWDQATPAPTVSTWRRVWQRIERAAWAPDSLAAPAWRAPWAMPGRRYGGLPSWRLVAAAAACILLAVAWRPALPPAMRLASDVEISHLEVYEGATAFVISTGDRDATEVIWVLEADG